jgi:hypothetical protein
MSTRVHHTPLTRLFTATAATRPRFGAPSGSLLLLHTTENRSTSKPATGTVCGADQVCDHAKVRQVAAGPCSCMQPGPPQLHTMYSWTNNLFWVTATPPLLPRRLTKTSVLARWCMYVYSCTRGGCLGTIICTWRCLKAPQHLAGTDLHTHVCCTVPMATYVRPHHCPCHACKVCS